jgi:hypothetical protein
VKSNNENNINDNNNETHAKEVINDIAILMVVVDD